MFCFWDSAEGSLLRLTPCSTSCRRSGLTHPNQIVSPRYRARPPAACDWIWREAVVILQTTARASLCCYHHEAALLAINLCPARTPGTTPGNGYAPRSFDFGGDAILELSQPSSLSPPNPAAAGSGYRRATAGPPTTVMSRAFSARFYCHRHPWRVAPGSYESRRWRAQELGDS
jgi:hypothetical protein